MNSDLQITKILAAMLYLAYSFLVANCGDDPYNSKERASLEKFRPLVQNILYRDYMKEDHYLIRWLRARDLDISEARIMLGKAIRWRKKNKIDSILNETISIKFPIVPYYHDGVSYSGSPVSVINIRAFEIKKLILAGQKAEFARFLEHGLELSETGIQYLTPRFPDFPRLIMIFDFSGYNQRQHGCFSCVLLFQGWIRNYENYYPQLIKKMIIVNAPRVIKPLLNAIKPFLSQHTQKTLKVFGQNKKEWRREIFKIVPRNQVRRGLGGTKPDHIPCAPQDFVCICKGFFGSAGKGTNTTISLSAGLRKLDADIC